MSGHKAHSRKTSASPRFKIEGKKTAAMYSVRVSVLHIFMLYEVNVFPHLTCLHIHITCKGTEGEKLLLK